MLNIKAIIGKAAKDDVSEDKVGTLWEGFSMAKKIYIKGANFSQQSKEGT